MLEKNPYVISASVVTCQYFAIGATRIERHQISDERKMKRYAVLFQFIGNVLKKVS